MKSSFSRRSFLTTATLGASTSKKVRSSYLRAIEQERELPSALHGRGRIPAPVHIRPGNLLTGEPG